MITKESILQYQYPMNKVDENSIVIMPHKRLQPYIANYTFTNPSNMPIQQMLLPTMSSTLVCSISDTEIISGLRGINTKPVKIADYARKFEFMFLVEFHASGLYPFLRINQANLVDRGFLLADLDKLLNQQITDAYNTSLNIKNLVNKLDSIFLSRIKDFKSNSNFMHAFKRILENKGNIYVKNLAEEVHYSEKQLNRLFVKYVGVNVKICSRIIRMKNAIDLLANFNKPGELFELTGHHDYAHFIHDFTNIYGFTPKEYMSKMSLFYNDPFKL